MKRHGGRTQIGVEPPTGFQQHFLNHVARVHPSRDGRVEAQANHAPHRIAMHRHEPTDGLTVSATSLVEKLLGLAGFWFHERIVVESPATSDESGRSMSAC